MPVWLSLMLMILAVAVLTGVAASALMARILLRPERMSDAKAFWYLRRTSPGELGLPSEDLEFVVRDAAGGGKLTLAAWWIPAAAPSDKTVILIHGYSDAKVGAIAWAPMFHRLGFNILAYDQRAHGRSGGIHSTGGFYEREDLDQLLDDLLARFPAHTRKIILFGISLGATAAAAVAARQRDIAAAILESPYADYCQAFGVLGDAQGSPGRVFQRLACWLAQKKSGADFAQVRPAELIAAVPGPLMVIQSENDPVSSVSRVAVEAAVAKRRERGLATATYEAHGARHVLGLAQDTQAYTAAVEQFLADL